eukprot:SAG11_NODE_2819_length_2940_cov_31.391059_4_plen_138_part_00
MNVATAVTAAQTFFMLMLPATDASTVQVDGYTVVPAVLTAQQAASILRSVETTLASEAYALSVPGSTFVNFDQSYVPFLADPRVLGIAEQLFGPAGSHTRIASTSVVVSEVRRSLFCRRRASACMCLTSCRARVPLT